MIDIYNKKISVLLDSEIYSGNFIHCIGFDRLLSSSYIVKKIINYDKYYINNNFNETLNNIKKTSGLIIISSVDNYYKLFDVINLYCKNLDNMNILIVIEDYKNTNYVNNNFEIYEKLNYNKKKIKINPNYIINSPNIKYEILYKTFNHKDYIKSYIGLENMKIFNKNVIFDKQFLNKKTIKKYNNLNKKTIENYNKDNNLNKKIINNKEQNNVLFYIFITIILYLFIIIFI